MASTGGGARLKSSRWQTSGHLVPSGTCGVVGYENPGGPLFFLAWVIVPPPDHGDTLVIGEDEYSLGHFRFEVCVGFLGEPAIRQDWTLSCLLTWIIGRI